MAKSLIRQYSKKELEKMVKESTSMRELQRKLGYKSIGSNYETIQKVLDEYNISTKHFTGVAKGATKRNEENVFVKDSTANQAVLRRWYLKGQYSEYKCAICGLPAQWQGKPLTLTLDHINGDNHDDRLENLRWICPNCDRQTETFAGKNVEHKKEKHINYCIDCGKEISYGATRCNDCENQHRKMPIVNMPITRNELKKLIRTTPFTTIAAQYNVTDNAVRKWCDKLSLPRKVSDIKKYTDEEWELL